MFYSYVFTKPKKEYSKNTQLSITFASGYIAGVICALVSQPADNLVSLRAKAEHRHKSFGTLINEVRCASCSRVCHLVWVCQLGCGTESNAWYLECSR